MKTLVIAKHEHGPAQNGHDGCYARCGADGMCPGIKTAEWLNSLGEDHEQYIKWPSGDLRATNIDVRMNWLRRSDHIVAKDRRLAELSAEQSRLRAELRVISRKLAQAQKEAVV